MTTWRNRCEAVAVTAATFFIGSLPWWWVSLGDRFLTLKPLPITAHDTVFSGRLSLFHHRVLPSLFGIAQYASGSALFTGQSGTMHAALRAGIILVLVTATLAGLYAGGARRAIALATAASPFIYAYFPDTWFWQDGRYAIYLSPIYFLTIAIGLEQAVLWKRNRLGGNGRVIVERLVVLSALIFAISWTSWQFGWWMAVSKQSAPLFSGYSASDAPLRAQSNALLRMGIRTGWGDYFTVYRLDFVTGGTLHLSPPPADTVRVPAYLHDTEATPNPVWLFTGRSNPTGTRPAGPDAGPQGLIYGQFAAALHARGITLKATDLDGLWVITTSKPVDPAQVGL